MYDTGTNFFNPNPESQQKFLTESYNPNNIFAKTSKSAKFRVSTQSTRIGRNKISYNDDRSPSGQRAHVLNPLINSQFNMSSVKIRKIDAVSQNIITFQF